MNFTAKRPPPSPNPQASLRADAPERFRRLKQNEVVSQGDFVATENFGFEPWDGPSGFQARAFLKPIYRKHLNQRPRPKQIQAKANALPEK